MTVYPKLARAMLSDPDRRMLLEESGLDAVVVAERGYFTARRGEDVPQDRGELPARPGLVIPMFSPDGITRSYQLRPHRKGKGPKYWTPTRSKVIVDVHPRMLEEVRHGDGDLWITEGCKKGDALTSRGLPAISLAGVWMWCVPKKRPYRLKACFDHVRLERHVYVVFDNDVMVKAEVQQALEALVYALEGRGAEVLVVYLPPGEEKGVDDFLAGGAS
jgi:uncharacterized protein DUF3854